MRVAVFAKPPRLIEIVASVFVRTGLVLIENVAVLLPAGTVTETGVVAEGVELASETTIPPGGASEDSLTVPTAVLPPVKLVGSTDREESDGGSITICAETAVPADDAVIVTAVCVATGAVLIVYSLPSSPAGTVTESGTMTEFDVDVSFTFRPPGGADPFSSMTPVAVAPPNRVEGETPIADGEGGSSSKVVATLWSFQVASSVIVVGISTGFVLTINVNELPPGGIVTDGCMVTDVELPLSFTTIFACAFTVRATVPPTAMPPTTLAGLTVR